MNIKEMYKQGKEMGLEDKDIYPHCNPQRLTMRELKERINNLPNERDNNFRGGACSGD